MKLLNLCFHFYIFKIGKLDGLVSKATFLKLLESAWSNLSKKKKKKARSKGRGGEWASILTILCMEFRDKLVRGLSGSRCYDSISVLTVSLLVFYLSMWLPVFMYWLSFCGLFLPCNSGGFILVASCQRNKRHISLSSSVWKKLAWPDLDYIFILEWFVEAIQ